MTFRSLMIIKAIVCLVFGFLLLIIPGQMFSYYGINLDPGGMFPAREYGAAMLGWMFLCWLGRNMSLSDAKKAVIPALFVYNLIGFIATIFTVTAGILNGLGWFIVIIYLFFSVGFGYFLVKKTE